MTLPRDYARCPGKYNNVDHHGYEGNEMKTVNEIMELVEHHRTAGGSVEHHATKEALRTAIEELAADAERYQWLKANMTYVELGTYRAPNSELVSPMSRRWYHQTTDMQSNTIDELADKAMKGTT